MESGHQGMESSWQGGDYAEANVSHGTAGRCYTCSEKQRKSSRWNHIMSILLHTSKKMVDSPIYTTWTLYHTHTTICTHTVHVFACTFLKWIITAIQPVHVLFQLSVCHHKMGIVKQLTIAMWVHAHVHGWWCETVAIYHTVLASSSLVQ